MPCFGDDPVAEPRRSPAPRRPHDRSPRTPELHRSPETRFLDGAAVDLTIVRPAAAAPPRRLEQVEAASRVGPFRFGVVSLGPVYGWHPLSPSTAVSRRSAARGASGSVRSRVALFAGRSADRARRVVARLTRAWGFGAIKINAVFHCPSLMDCQRIKVHRVATNREVKDRLRRSNCRRLAWQFGSAAIAAAIEMLRLARTSQRPLQ